MGSAGGQAGWAGGAVQFEDVVAETVEQPFTAGAVEASETDPPGVLAAFHLADDGFDVDLAAGVDGLALLGPQLAGHAFLGGGVLGDAAPGSGWGGLAVLGAAGGDVAVDVPFGDTGGVVLGPVASVGDGLAGCGLAVLDDVVEDTEEMADVGSDVAHLGADDHP